MLKEMITRIEQRMHTAKQQLAFLGERARPIYEEEMSKESLRGTIETCKYLLSHDQSGVRNEARQEYRVELVDFIFATSETEAVEIFVKVMESIDVSDDQFDVYEVDSKHKKVRK